MATITLGVDLILTVTGAFLVLLQIHSVPYRVSALDLVLLQVYSNMAKSPGNALSQGHWKNTPLSSKPFYGHRLYRITYCVTLQSPCAHGS